MTLDELTIVAARVVEALQRKLPPAVRALATGVPVQHEALPSGDVIAEGFEPDILGLFTGRPHGETDEIGGPLPPQIVLYLENLWEFSGQDTGAFREEVRLTYLHELGHYLGWDEDEVASRGLE